jgi:hypothetical protein
MDLMEVLDQVRALLQSKGRLTYRLLKAQFHLDDEALAALKEELIEGEQVARDEHGKVLVWTGTREEQPAAPDESTTGEAPPSLLATQSTFSTPGVEAERRQLTVMGSIRYFLRCFCCDFVSILSR